MLLCHSMTSCSSRAALGRAARAQARVHARSLSSFKPVELAYDLTTPAEVRVEGQSLVICHGLFGSKQNWRSLAKMFAHRLGMPVYTVDLRNHGHSPHAEPHTYEAMAADLGLFMRTRGLREGVNLLGHSMGGKAVMAYALDAELNGPLRTLTSVDMSPARGKMSPEFEAYTDGMLEVERAQVATKAEADRILQKVEPELATRQFLLTNTMTKTSPSGAKHLTFRIPLPLLRNYVPQIGAFPFTPPPPDLPGSGSAGSPTSPTWDGPTLFIKGAHSRYINRHNIPVAKAFFPNMRLETLDAGHWVHAERPNETVDLVERFVRDAK
ncbi:hypothetical protein Q5752_005578 [Cryptotrichosporon argae]